MSTENIFNDAQNYQTPHGAEQYVQRDNVDVQLDPSFENTQAFLQLPFSERRPAFVSASTIEQHAERIREEVAPHLLAGIELFAKNEGLGEEALGTEDQRQAWLWATKSSKYNAVYYISRKEAADEIDFVKKNVETIDAIGDFIDSHGGAGKIANYALHSYVQGFAEMPGREVRTAKKSVPRYAIQGYDQDTLVVRKAHFLDTDPVASFNTPEEIHDWHDLAHNLAASSSNGAFGVKYHEGLDKLDRYYRALTEGEGMQDASGPLFSDGMLFTQLSKSVFEFYEGQKLPDGTNKYNYDQIQTFVAQELFYYLSGEHALYHPGIKEEIKAGRTIDTLELAVAEQNKRCERRAAEMEKELFVRGTPEGSRGNPAKDPLAGLSRSQRIQYTANLGDEPLYFEARNLTRHRAHEDALGQFANYLLEQKRTELAGSVSEADRTQMEEDIQLLDATVAFYQMDDLRQGEQINLYQMVHDIIGARNDRKNKAE